jgi:hypothetical protein
LRILSICKEGGECRPTLLLVRRKKGSEELAHTYQLVELAQIEIELLIKEAQRNVHSEGRVV